MAILEFGLVKKARWQVRLGELEWSRYTYARDDGDATFKLLGSIQKGQQRGALAQRPDGVYVMLVGDFETELNQPQIRNVLGVPSAATIAAYAPAAPQANPQNPAKVPVVIIKKRRTFTI